MLKMLGTEQILEAGAIVGVASGLLRKIGRPPYRDETCHYRPF